MTVASPVRREVTVTAEAGLHARPAADFAAAAGRYAAEVHVTKGERTADGKSVLLLLTLDVRRGDSVVIEATGSDALAAVDTLCGLVT
ncbi:MAG TPA: HPr family phosphocarrier protein [Mycobacteriales bacterium]|jgi:phosphotransferase system HPr (HPr) family protein|nr:HPr family phosphocarrier protein [Mycobacteriales bacterium]